MNRFIIPALFISSLPFFSSCREQVISGSGASKTEQRALSGYYNKVEIDAPVDATIQVVPGATPSLELSGYANVVAHIRTEIKDSTLHIFVPEIMHIDVDKNIQAQIILPSIAELSLAGSSASTVKGAITGNSFSLDMAGSGDVTLDSLNVTNADISMAGSASLKVNGGTSETVSYDMAGSSDVHAYGLKTTNTEVDIAGSASLELTANAKLDVDIAGSGDVKYKGHPVITQDIAGSGDLTDTN